MKHLISIIFVFATTFTFSQASLNWVKVIGSTDANDNDEPFQMQTDGEGNIYVCGFFEGVMDCDPGEGVSEITCIAASTGNNAFLAKYSAGGELIWVDAFQSTMNSMCRALTLDLQGNPIVAVMFSGNVSYEPGNATSVYNSLGEHDILISNYNKMNGSMIWAFMFGNSDNNWVNSIESDGLGNFVVAGQFYGTIDFDPSAEEFNLEAEDESNNMYMAKYSENLDFLWAKNITHHAFGQSNFSFGREMDFDVNGNLVVVGSFEETADFDPTANVYEVEVSDFDGSGYTDVFVAKYSADGNLLWAKGMGGPLTDEGRTVVTDASGNIYMTGFFRELADLDASPDGEQLFYSNDESQDIFFTKFDADGNQLWIKHMGGYSWDYPRAIDLDNEGHLYLAGEYTDVVDFDPGSGEMELDAGGDDNLFIAVYDADGNFLHVSEIRGTSGFGDAKLNDMNLVGEKIYVTGCFNEPMDFDCSDEEDIVDAPFGDYDVFFGVYTAPGLNISIDEEEINSSFVISPNPASNEIIIQSVNGFLQNGFSDVKIFSATGQLALQASLDFSLDVSTLSEGVYIIEIFGERQKLLKQ